MGLKLTNRKEAILKALVDLYIKYGKPIGSGIIAKEYDFGLSPATIRIELSDLESLGYIKSPGVATGRIPTEKGIKLYVEKLMSRKDISEEKKVLIKREISSYIGRDFFETMFLMSSLLSKLSNYAGIVYGPFLRNTIIKRIEIIPLGGKDIVTVLVTRSGIILHKKITLPRELDKWDLYKIENYLNEKLNNKDFSSMEREIIKAREEKPYELPTFSDEILYIIRSFKDLENKNQILKVDGIQNIIKLMENVSKDAIVKFLSFVEDDKLKEVISLSISKNDINVSVDFEDFGYLCTIVTKAFLIGDTHFGILGILGPLRMPYDRIIPLVNFVSNSLSFTLTNITVGV